jgi:hypothetical protein
MEKCESCRYWSEMIAQSEGYEVAALCLSSRSPHYSKYTIGKNGCNDWAENYLGAVDAPGVSIDMYCEQENIDANREMIGNDADFDLGDIGNK